MVLTCSQLLLPSAATYIPAQLSAQLIAGDCIYWTTTLEQREAMTVAVIAVKEPAGALE